MVYLPTNYTIKINNNSNVGKYTDTCPMDPLWVWIYVLITVFFHHKDVTVGRGSFFFATSQHLGEVGHLQGYATKSNSSLSGWWFFTNPSEKYARQIGS